MITMFRAYLGRALLIASMLGMGWWLQSQGLSPCVLCWAQRYVLMFLLCIMILGLFIKNYHGTLRVFSLLGVMFLLIFSIRHLWLIYGASSSSSCLLDLGLSTPSWWENLWGDYHDCGQEKSAFLGVPLSLWVMSYACIHGIIDLFMWFRSRITS
ncbi:MAG: disulfide bond formation protein B [Candidatus Comchoanobacterales bacterium]